MCEADVGRERSLAPVSWDAEADDQNGSFWSKQSSTSEREAAEEKNHSRGFFHKSENGGITTQVLR